MSTVKHGPRVSIGTLGQGVRFREWDKEKDRPQPRTLQLTSELAPCTLDATYVHVQVDGARNWCIHSEEKVVLS